MGTQITTFTTIVTESMRGFQNITLTNWDNVAEPELNEGGRCEISSALFKLPANEDIDASNNFPGFPNDTQLYGYYLVAGANLTCELTDTPPTWQEEKGGWYDTASDTNRFWGGLYKDAGGDYADKFIYDGRTLKYQDTLLITERGHIDNLTVDNGIDTDGTFLKTKVIEIGNWNMDVDDNVVVAHGLTQANIRSMNVIIRNDLDTSYFDFAAHHNTANVTTFKYISAEAANIVIGRATGGPYDSASYDSVGGFNRGWITITYKA